MPFIHLHEEDNEGLNQCSRNGIKIMIFTEGTVIHHKNLPNIMNFKTYILIGDCVNKIVSWEQQGAVIVYITSRKTKKQIGDIASVLRKYNFTGDQLYYRGTNEKYKDVIELVQPDILIEDDCKSIGGQSQMCITYVKEEIKNKIKSIPVEEFKGIDHLPELFSEL